MARGTINLSLKLHICVRLSDIEVPDGPDLVDPIFHRYDADKNGRLSPSEIGFDPATFARLFPSPLILKEKGASLPKILSASAEEVPA